MTETLTNADNFWLCMDDPTNLMVISGFLEFEKLSKDKIDLHSLKLKDTNYLLCHDDDVGDRKIAFIINLSKEWDREMGGELQLFDSIDGEPKSIAKTITPDFNQLRQESRFKAVQQMMMASVNWVD